MAAPLRTEKTDDALLFSYDSGEKALAAAKRAVRRHADYRFHRTRLPDGTDCFEVTEGTTTIERHVVKKDEPLR